MPDWTPPTFDDWTPPTFTEPSPEPSPEPAPEPSPEPTPEPAPEPVDRAAEQQKRLDFWISEYTDLLPRIATASPLQPQPSDGELVGAERVAESVRQALAKANPARFRVSVGVSGDAVLATVRCRSDAENRQAIGASMCAELAKRRHCGGFVVVLDEDRHVFHLLRRGVTGPGRAWRSAGAKASAFFESGEGQRRVFTVVKLFQTRKSDGAKRYPKVHSFGEDSRGGTVELRLPEGMLAGKVVAAEAALRQALNAPELTVSANDGNPILHLNSKALAKDFPKVNPLRPELFVRPRTQAERHAAAKDFVLPLGVKADGSPILIPQDKVPHTAIFGGTGNGKTVLLSSIIQAAVLQGAEVLLADAKNGKDLRRLARDGLPGVTHYSVCEAGLHRLIRYAYDELTRRKVLGEALAAKGIDYNPTPLLLVFDEVGAWIDDAISGGDKAAKAAAQMTVAALSYLAAQARELRIFLLLAGQHAYVSAFSGKLRSNTSTLVILGEPTERNRLALFEGEKRDQVRELGSTIPATVKGRGVVADMETGKVQLFQGFWNPPGPDADRFDSAVRAAPKLRRFGWKFPLPGEDGGDGSWQEWTPASDPSSDSLPTIYLDGPDGNPDPATAVYDITSPQYSPGVRPLRSEHEHRSSYDN